MKKQDIFTSIGNIDDNRIAMAAKQRKKRTYAKWIAVAACICLAVVAASIPFMQKAFNNNEYNNEYNGNNAYDYNLLYAGYNLAISNKLAFDNFDTDLIDYIAQTQNGNYMVSPLSFRYAMGLVLAGANGQTKQQILNAFNVRNEAAFALPCEQFNAYTAGFAGRLQEDIDFWERYGKTGGKPYRAINVANSAWYNQMLISGFKDEYKDSIQKHYYADIYSFTPQNAVQNINAWANAKTNGLIKELIGKDYDASNLAVVLMNALYYKNRFCSPFSNYATNDGDFTTANGDTVQKQFMHQTEDFAYYADSKTELVIMPMEDGVYMCFAKGDTADIDKKISKAKICKVELSIPKFEVETSLDHEEFIAFLQSKGVVDMFDVTRADFTAMATVPTYVDDIIQKTVIKLNENGVEAAAVTVVMNKAIAMPEKPVTFTADSPFSFYIYTNINNSSAVMFAGQINE